CPAKLFVYKPALIVISTVNPIIGNFDKKSGGGIEQGKSILITTRRNFYCRCVSESTQLCFGFLCCVYSLSKQPTAIILRSQAPVTERQISHCLGAFVLFLQRLEQGNTL